MEFNKENVLFEIRSFGTLFSNDGGRVSSNTIELERRIYAMEEEDVISSKLKRSIMDKISNIGLGLESGNSGIAETCSLLRELYTYVEGITSDNIEVTEKKPSDIPDLIVWVPGETLAFYNVSNFKPQLDYISFDYKSNTNNAKKKAYLKPLGWSLTVKENASNETK